MPQQIKIWHFCSTVKSAILLQIDQFCTTKRRELPNMIFNVIKKIKNKFRGIIRHYQVKPCETLPLEKSFHSWFLPSFLHTTSLSNKMAPSCTSFRNRNHWLDETKTTYHSSLTAKTALHFELLTHRSVSFLLGSSTCKYSIATYPAIPGFNLSGEEAKRGNSIFILKITDSLQTESLNENVTSALLEVNFCPPSKLDFSHTLFSKLHSKPSCQQPLEKCCLIS